MDRDIHPEIRKFWEDQGFTIEIFKLLNLLKWYAEDESNKIDIACLGINDIIYYYNFNNYTEQEMLQFIRLRAFW